MTAVPTPSFFPWSRFVGPLGVGFGEEPGHGEEAALRNRPNFCIKP